MRLPDTEFRIIRDPKDSGIVSVEEFQRKPRSLVHIRDLSLMEFLNTEKGMGLLKGMIEDFGDRERKEYKEVHSKKERMKMYKARNMRLSYILKELVKKFVSDDEKAGGKGFSKDPGKAVEDNQKDIEKRK